MSMIKGIKAPNEKWRKMKQVYDACIGVGVEIPNEVSEFFNGDPPDDSGVIIDLDDHESVMKWDDGDMREGFQVEIAKLPKNLTHIRFVNSY